VVAHWQARLYQGTLNKRGEQSMAWALLIGMAFTGIGILVGLYLPILAAQYAVPEKIRIYAITGAVLVVIGTALQIVSVWPTADVDAEQAADD
jgi:hypothetical protein